jgi:tetratricopeptide (TPR) repeat protein
LEPETGSAEGARASPPRYRAFISYSHLDLAAVKRLHRQLEGYRVPARLVGKTTARGLVEQRLRPIFRDVDELPASDDLSAEIKAALAASEALIVVASPAAKASRWVGREIETFRELHGDTRPILVALIAGEPEEAFPEAITLAPTEPIAADFRKSGSGRRLATMKLIAGLTDLSLDALVQRDAQRNLRRVMTITVGALAAVLIMAMLLVAALRARAEADRQRAEAEGLVEYMLTDLRDRLKGVGRLDVMTAVNERAMAYYGDSKSLNGLTPESLIRRSRILHAMGEDDDKRGNLDLALAKFKEAHRTTAAVLAQKPNNADAIFAHAQSEYWLGYELQMLKRFREALAHDKAYGDLAKRYAQATGNSRAAQMEVAWAENLIGALYLKDLKEPEIAASHFKAYADIFQNLVASDPGDTKARYSLADALGWLADCHFATARFAAAKQQREAQRAQLQVLLEGDPQNSTYRIQMMTTRSELFRICFRQKDLTCAQTHVDEALRIANQSGVTDLSNSEWLRSLGRMHFNRAYLFEATGKPAEARGELATLRTISGTAERLGQRDDVFDSAMLSGLKTLERKLDN